MWRRRVGSYCYNSDAFEYKVGKFGLSLLLRDDALHVSLKLMRKRRVFLHRRKGRTRKDWKARFEQSKHYRDVRPAVFVKGEERGGA